MEKPSIVFPSELRYLQVTLELFGHRIIKGNRSSNVIKKLKPAALGQNRLSQVITWSTRRMYIVWRISGLMQRAMSTPRSQHPGLFMTLTSTAFKRSCFFIFPPLPIDVMNPFGLNLQAVELYPSAFASYAWLSFRVINFTILQIVCNPGHQSRIAISLL